MISFYCGDYFDRFHTIMQVVSVTAGAATLRPYDKPYNVQTTTLFV